MCAKSENWMKDKYVMAVRCTEAALRTFMAQKSFDPDVIYECGGSFTIVWGWPDRESFTADRKQREDVYAVMDGLDPLRQDNPFPAWYASDMMYSMILYGEGAVMDKMANTCERGTMPTPRLEVSLIMPEGKVDDVSYLKEENDTAIYIKGPVNTRIQYSSCPIYSGSFGEKASYDVVVRGRLSQDDIDCMEASLNCDGSFVPFQVLLPGRSDIWFTFDRERISETIDPPTVNISAKKLVRKFVKAYVKGWQEDLPFE